MFDWKQDPHRRYNPLSREWVLVSPHRTQRPWQGQVEKTAPPAQPEYDPECYLCPGNSRAGGVRNPKYTTTFVFDNDFAALKPATPLDRFDRDGLLIAETEPGVCRVLCFSPKHNLTIANMELADLRTVVDAWVAQYRELSANPLINYVQIFENRGAMMGASNPHPHCQIWSNHSIPNEVAKEQAAQLAWRERAWRLPALPVPGSRRIGPRPHRGGKRKLADAGALLGSVAVRDHGDRETAHAVDRRPDGRRAQRARRHPETHYRALRPFVRRLVPVLDGFPPAPHRRRRA